MRTFMQALKMFLLMALLTGLIYPLLITYVAQLTMPSKSNGSLVRNAEIVIGSSLLAQNFKEERYFWPRPSAIDYDPLKPSGGSNLGPISQKLKEAVEERKKKIGEDAPPELLYASASGLDPHISIKTAYYQIKRVAKARGVKEEDVAELIDIAASKHMNHSYVNVLLLNQMLDLMKSES